MEKKVRTIVLGGCLLILMSGCGGEKMNQFEQIKAEYMELCTKMNDNSEMPQTEIAASYANLCKQISEGKDDQAREYADLLEEITGGTVTIAEDEVFELAKDYGEIFAELASSETDFGLQDIVIAGQNETIITVSYKSDVRAYSVEQMGENEMEYSGDSLVSPDGSLGRYRMKIVFYDAKPSNVFLQKYPVGEVHQIANYANEVLNMRCEYTSDHGFVIYIGSEAFLGVNKQDITELTRPIGDVEIIIGKDGN